MYEKYCMKSATCHINQSWKNFQKQPICLLTSNTYLCHIDVNMMQNCSNVQRASHQFNIMKPNQMHTNTHAQMHTPTHPSKFTLEIFPPDAFGRIRILCSVELHVDDNLFQLVASSWQGVNVHQSSGPRKYQCFLKVEIRISILVQHF